MRLRQERLLHVHGRLVADKKKRTAPVVTLTALMKKAAVPMPASDAPSPNPWAKAMAKGDPVPDSRDLQRIIAIPRRTPEDLKSERMETMVALINERYTNGVPAGGHPGNPCECRNIDPNRFKNGANGCITTVLPIQAWALYEMGIAGGCVGSIPVGAGKTMLDILAVFALGANRALALIPSNLLGQFWDDYRLLREHFKVPTVFIEGPGHTAVIPGAPELRVLPYGLLSRPGKSDYIDNWKPDAIICDEVDKLADIRGSATARRVLRYYVSAPWTKFAGWTGSLTDKKISEYTHVIVMALKDELAPVPTDPREVEHWGDAIDVTEQPRHPGALTKLFNAEEAAMTNLRKAARRAYYRRLSDTMGILMTSENDVEVSDAQGPIKNTKVEIIIEPRKAPEIPPIITQMLESARKGVRMDRLLGARSDEELDSPMEVARTIHEIASGISNVWEFPPLSPDGKRFLDVKDGGIEQPDELQDEWYRARKLFNKATRIQCLEGIQNLDSPYLCEQAAKRFWGELPADGKPVWECYEWPDWRDIKDRVKPRPVAKRIDPYLAQDAANWARENKGIVWYSLKEFGAWVSELSGLPMHGGGTKAAKRLKNETGDTSIIASIESHGRGRNGLQFLFDSQLIAQTPSSARRWEQLFGRLIRRGQMSEKVVTWVYQHVPELVAALEQALKRSEYVEETLGMRQKLLKGWKPRP